MSKTFVIAAAVCCLFASVVRSDCPEDLPTKEGFELEKVRKALRLMYVFF